MASTKVPCVSALGAVAFLLPHIPSLEKGGLWVPKRNQPAAPNMQTNQVRGARTRRFITAFTTARQRSVSWVRWIHSTPPSQPISLRSVLIPSSHLRLGLSSGLFPSRFPTKTLYTFLPSPMRATCPAHLNSPWFVLPNDIWWWAQVMKFPMPFEKKSYTFWARHSVGLRNQIHRFDFVADFRSCHLPKK
jgi:hypothetical protein